MLKYIPNAPLSEITWYKIGGKAKYLFYPRDVNEIRKCLNFIRGQNLPFFIIGGGSNVLIGDNDFSGAVICTRELNHIELVDDFTIKAGAGALADDVSLFALENELEGCEFLHKLPGSIGGAAVMNAQAFGSRMSDIVRVARCVDFDGNVKVFTNRELEYDYKKSILQHSDFILNELELILEKGEEKVIKAKMDYNKNVRENNKHFDFPSCGCVFKNKPDENVHAGKLIDDLGLKGESVGGAKIYEAHANFIVNYNNAKAGDVLKLIDIIKNQAQEKKDVKLELEMELLGNFGENEKYSVIKEKKKNK